MNYLTSHELRALNAISTFTARELTATERAVKALIAAIQQPAEAGQEMVRDQAIRQCLMVMNNTTNNMQMINLANEATQDPNALKSLISGYPYLEFEEYIRNPQLSGVMLAAYHNVAEEKLRAAVQWVASLHDMINHLPEGLEMYLGTPFTPHVHMRAAAKYEGRKDCFGLTLPYGIQARITGLFGNGYAEARHTARKYKLYEDLGINERFGISYDFNPTGHNNPNVQYSNTVIDTTDTFAHEKFDAVEVVRFKTLGKASAQWVGTYKFVVGAVKS